MHHNFREDFGIWAHYPGAESEELSQGGETVLHALTEEGIHGRARRVRVTLIAAFGEAGSAGPRTARLLP
ncbi:hypothetical protein PUR49_06430 [Streptomyces sp. BE147]|uniref:hypothetical protein n=1 Tax=Streptomyces sp. BE147 TaxID=3002524 RepID=UPI002E789E06|nr:hypothetical protein [Streptomyces sp. BE147]MEE1736148.1 hypothetical protein [Streptomyces sp. BE147]